MPENNERTQKQIDETEYKLSKHLDSCINTHSKISDRLADGAKKMGVLETRIGIMEVWKTEQSKIISDFKTNAEKKLGDQSRLLVGILVALATAAVLLALNVLIMQNGEGPSIIETLVQRLL